MKGVQCYELFGGIALKIHTFSFLFIFSFILFSFFFPNMYVSACILCLYVYKLEIKFDLILEKRINDIYIFI